MQNTVLVEKTLTEETKTQFSREDVLQLLDEAPDGYKYLARLIKDPYELLQGGALNSYDPHKRRNGKPEELLKNWLIARLAV